MAGFAERYIGAFQAGAKDGQQAKVDETIQKFGTLASQGDQQAMNQIYGVDPGAAAQLETQFSSRNKSGAEWDQYVQEQAGRVAHSVLTAPPEQRAQRVASGIDFMTGLTRRDPRFKTVIDGWKQKLQAGDMPGIESELNAVLERTMGFKEKYAGTSANSTATERALAELYPDPKDRARALIEMEAGKDRYVQTPNGMMVIPGKMPSGMPSAPAAAAPAPGGAKPFATYTGGQQPPAGPRPSSAPGYADGPVVPNGGYVIPGTEKPLPADTRKAIATAREAIQIGTTIDKDLLDFQTKIENGTMQLGPLSNMYAEGANAGYLPSTKSAEAYGSFNAALTRLQNESLRLNTGVQTDGDAKRAWGELIANLGNQQYVLARLKEIREINRRGAQLQYEKMQASSQEFGREVEPFENIVKSITGAYGGEQTPPPVTTPPPAPAPTQRTAPPAAAPRTLPTPQDRAAQWQAAVEQYARQHNIAPEQANEILLRRAQQRMQQQ
jgi:hypothetical protein